MLVSSHIKLKNIQVLQAKQLATSGLQTLQFLFQLGPLSRNGRILPRKILCNLHGVGAVETKPFHQRWKDVSPDPPHEVVVNCSRNIVCNPLIRDYSWGCRSLEPREIWQTNLPWKYARTSAMMLNAGSIGSLEHSFINSSARTSRLRAERCFKISEIRVEGLILGAIVGAIARGAKDVST